MIRYCLSAILLVACSGTGPKQPTIVPDPVPVIVMPEIEIRALRLVEPEHLRIKPIKRARAPRCADTSENTKEEFLAKLECVKKLTEEGGA